MNRIGILTGGGDAPGLNAVIRAAVKTAILEFGCEVFGIRDGYDGFIDDAGVVPLGLKDVSGILSRGGTILGAANRGNPYARKVIRDGKEVTIDVSDEIVKGIQRLKMDALLVVGGDGTLRIAHELYVKGVPVVGVPKTIDNDIGGTDVTFGFDTALNIATEAIDRLHTTAEAHHRVMVLELMGREAGFIALHAGVAGGADVILIPEIPFKFESVIAKIRQRAERGSLFSSSRCRRERSLWAAHKYSRAAVMKFMCRGWAVLDRKLANTSRNRDSKPALRFSGISNAAARQQVLIAGLPRGMAQPLSGWHRAAALTAWSLCAQNRSRMLVCKRRWQFLDECGLMKTALSLPVESGFRLETNNKSLLEKARLCRLYDHFLGT